MVNPLIKSTGKIKIIGIYLIDFLLMFKIIPPINKMSDKKYLEIEYKNLYEKVASYNGGFERFKFDNPEEARRLELMKYTLDNYK